ncbi:hypothetical protein [Burkholderia anthina]|uniref:hypothetical protein n=1 Tax=Burkholderia anthina TaxID=179879 RepID=UPI00158A6FAA|nr:hypothetical protein [Burkholderia anthina]
MDLSNFISDTIKHLGWITCAAVATAIVGLTVRSGFERLRGWLPSPVEKPRLAAGSAQIVTVGRSGLAFGSASAATHGISKATVAAMARPKTAGTLSAHEDGARYLAVPYPIDDGSGLVFYRLIPLG